MGIVDSILILALLVMLPLSWQRQRTRAKELLALAAEQETLYRELVSTVQQRRSTPILEKQRLTDEPTNAQSQSENSSADFLQRVRGFLTHHSYENLVFEKDAGLARIILNRPQKVNALSDALRWELLGALDQCARDSEVRVVMLKGAGRHFCAGVDLRETRGPTNISHATAIITAIRELPKPVVAVLHGYAVGEGFELALSCDVRVAAADTKLGLTGVKFGMVPSLYAINLLVQGVGIAYATNLLLTGEVIEIQEALRAGLIHQIVPADELESCADKWAAKLQEGSPAAIGFMKLSLSKVAGLGEAENLEILASQLAELLREHSRFQRETPRSWILPQFEEKP